MYFIGKILSDNWTKLRENFRRCLNRRKKATKSGAGGQALPSCQFFTELSFLNDVIGVRSSTCSNIKSDIFTPPPSPADNQRLSPFTPPSSPADNQRLSPTIMTRTISSVTNSDYDSSHLSAAAVRNVPITNSLEPASSKQVVPNSGSIQNKLSHTNKRKQQIDPVQSALEKAIIADVENNKNNETDPDELFCKSLVSSFKNLPKKKNKRAKIKVLQVLLDMEDSDIDENTL